MIVSFLIGFSPYALLLIGFWPQVGSAASTGGFYAFVLIANAFGIVALISATSMIAEIVEDLGADAVVIGVTRQRKRQTETFAIPFGNLHAVRGVAEFIYGTLADEDDEDDEVVLEDEDDE